MTDLEPDVLDDDQVLPEDTPLEGLESADLDDIPDDVPDLGLLEQADEFALDTAEVVPLQANEFTCTSCFLVAPVRNRVAGTTMCLDCA